MIIPRHKEIGEQLARKIITSEWANSSRNDETPSKMIVMADTLEALEAPKAAERMKASGHLGGGTQRSRSYLCVH